MRDTSMMRNICCIVLNLRTVSPSGINEPTIRVVAVAPNVEAIAGS